MANAELKGVTYKIEINNENVVGITFQTTLLVVFSLLCIYNIEPKADQKKRVLKLQKCRNQMYRFIGDYIRTKAYSNVFKLAGLKVPNHILQLLLL